jgi:uncharacterized membrane protein (DUF106 family)
MSLVNALLRKLFDIVLFPFRGLHPLVGLIVLAIPISVLMLLVFKRTSNQEKLADVKGKIFSGLFEIRLFNDDLGAIFRAQGDILRHNLSYLGLSLVPLAWMIIPFILLIGQLQFHYGYQGLHPGKETLVKVQLADDWREQASTGGGSARPPLALEVPEGLELTSPGVWLPALNEMAWRLEPRQRGNYELRVKFGDESYGKSLRVSDDVVRRSPERISGGPLDQLLHPAEKPLRKGPIAAIFVDYPRAGGEFFDLSSWVWIFFGLTIVLAFALRKPFKVTI